MVQLGKGFVKPRPLLFVLQSLKHCCTQTLGRGVVLEQLWNKLALREEIGQCDMRHLHQLRQKRIAEPAQAVPYNHRLFEKHRFECCRSRGQEHNVGGGHNIPGTPTYDGNRKLHLQRIDQIAHLLLPVPVHAGDHQLQIRSSVLYPARGLKKQGTKSLHFSCTTTGKNRQYGCIRIYSQRLPHLEGIRRQFDLPVDGPRRPQAPDAPRKTLPRKETGSTSG